MSQFDLNSWICPKCGTLNSSDVDYCVKCDYEINECEKPKKAKLLIDNDTIINQKNKTLNE